jgi:putative spermidine/putrescine transport system permease protein
MTAGEVFFRWLARAGRGAGVLAFLFMVVPILVILPLSFTAGVELVYPMPGTSLRWYDDFFTRPEWLHSIRVSLLVGTAAAAGATVLGTTAALGLPHLPRRLRDLVSALLILPMAIPSVICAVAFFFFYARINLAGTYPGLVLAHMTLGLPFVVINVRAALAGLNPNLLRAAHSLGAPPLRAFRRVVLPLIGPGITSGALFAFAASLDDVVVAMFVGGPAQLTLPRQMFNGLRENISPTILAAAALLTVVSTLMMVATSRLSARASRLQQG